MPWRTLNGQTIDGDIKDRVEAAILRETALGYKLKVCIGSDSMVRGQEVQYATVIVLLREKRGGFMFIRNKTTAKNNISIKERMLHEVSMSVNTAYTLCALLNKYNVELEVHADINTDPEFKSSSALKEAMGYILGMGFIFKAKPEAFASSCCADKFV